jgi:hypothetical protein
MKRMSSVSIQHPNVKEHQLMKRRKALWDMLSSVTLLSNSFFKETFPYSAMNWRHIKAQQEIRNICFPILEFVTSKFYIYVYSYTSNTSWWSHSLRSRGLNCVRGTGISATFLGVMFQLSVMMHGLTPHHMSD